DTSFIPMRFILLAGDVDVIPNFTGTEMDNPPTDLYYSLLSGSDYMPDVYIGRFPSSDTLSLRTMSQKSIMFEKAEWGVDDSWANKAYLMASDDPSFHLVAESTQIYAASKLRSEFMEVDSMFDYYNSGTQVSTALNEGRSIVVYSGHGSYTAWAGPYFSQTDIENLTNNDMIPIVSSYACLTGNYALPYDCFGESWVKKESGGAVSYMGSSVYSYWDEDDYMERSFFDALSDSGWMVAGKLMNAGKFGVFTAYSGGGLSKRYYEMYNILGDPSLGFYTGVKDTLKINVMNPLPEAASELEVTVYGDGSSLPVENALVSLTFNQSLYAVSYTDSSGKVVFSNPGFFGDTLFFTASKPSYRQGESFTILSSSSFYPFISKTLFSDTIFTINGSDLSYSPLETGSFDIMVKNLGESSIISLECSLATTGSLIDFKSYTAEFSETIGIGDSSWVKVPLISFVKEGIRNNSRDTILFFMRDAYDSAIVYKKQMKILSPDIIINSPEYSFSEGINSGDTVKMTVRAINGSATDDRSISLKFISKDTTLIQFIDSTSGFDFIGGFDTLTSDTMSFFVSSEDDSFFTASFMVLTRDTFGIEDTFDFSLSFNKKDYLVLDYSKDNLSALFIDSILGELGYSGSYALSVDVKSLGNYKNIFMSAGEYPNNRVISAGDSVAAAIDSLCREGKLNLYLEGGEMWFWDLYTGQGYDFQPLTKIDGRADGDMLGNFEITGEENSIGEGISITYDGGISADVLDTLLGAKQVFFKGDTLYAASYRDPLYKTVGSSLCVGSLVDADSVSSRKEWVRRIMLFFEGLIGVNELSMDSHLPEFKFISMSSPLSSNEFRIFYTAIRGEEVAFKVYNSAGMEVFSKKIPALASGLNSFTFNVSENNLASGVYFIRADNSKKSFTKKIAVIR
ncbi:MAG: C25 family cysteine peptidase, partial [bacterium]|nr:C25 family cysteine peptidase [bacterium]